MKYIGVAFIYMSFFGLIGATVYITESAWPLLALLFTPSWKSTNEDKD